MKADVSQGIKARDGHLDDTGKGLWPSRQRRWAFRETMALLSYKGAYGSLIYRQKKGIENIGFNPSMS